MHIEFEIDPFRIVHYGSVYLRKSLPFVLLLVLLVCCVVALRQKMRVRTKVLLIGGIVFLGVFLNIVVCLLLGGVLH